MAILLTSILDADWLNLSNEVRAVDKAGTDGFSIDIMDGIFVPRITFDVHIVSIIRNITNVPLEVHLMITNPEKQIEKFCDAGADLILVHVEASKDPLALIKYVHSRGLQAGLAILQETPLDAISDYMLESINALNLMAVPVGYGGQKPSDKTLERIQTIRERSKNINPNLAIEIDGGMKPENCSKYVEAGADLITIGTGIYKSGNYNNAINIAKENMLQNDYISRKRLETFLSCPSINLKDDIERRRRLEQIRVDLDIPLRSWNPMESKR